MHPSSWMLSCASYEDPSEILNLIDFIRKELSKLSEEEANLAERHCTLAELEIHTLYTPFEFIKLSVENICA